MTTGRINQGSLPNFTLSVFHFIYFCVERAHRETRRPDKSPPLSLHQSLNPPPLSILHRLLHTIISFDRLPSPQNSCVFAPFICLIICNASGDDLLGNHHLSFILPHHFNMQQYTTSIICIFSRQTSSLGKARITSR